MGAAWKQGLFAVGVFLFALLRAEAGVFPLSAVPDPLKTWVPWVLDDMPAAACPHLFNDADTRHCAWPGALELKVDARGGRFTQTWQLYRESWIPLPGENRHWPQEVKVNGRPVAVLSREGVPSLHLEAGEQQIEGRFFWSSLPESLALPEALALLRLDVDGQPLSLPRRDEHNTLWLQGEADSDGEEATQLQVYRKLIDGVPVQLETRLHLDVSGKARELRIGRALLDGLLPQALASPLPATLEQDGSLRVQARAGHWEITLLARHPGAVRTLALPPASGLLADEEVWVFEAAPLLRSASPEGVVAVDPQQTRLPDAWRRLPAYLLSTGNTLSFKEIRRGDSDPAPDKLALERRAWLSFDGSVLSMSDHLSARISRANRLVLGAPAVLGRVDINGQAQLITRDAGRGDGEGAGVELKRGPLTLNADSELPGAPRRFAAVGWQHDVDKLGMTLELPAGWRLLHVSGVDRAQGAWLAQWDLLDFFFVLLIALATRQLWGMSWGLLALAAMVLCYQEAGAPTWQWLCLLAAIALHRALPDGRVRRALLATRRLAWLGLLLLVLGFATHQLRQAIFPVLEKADTGIMALNPPGNAAAWSPAREEQETRARDSVSVSVKQERASAPSVLSAAPAPGDIAGAGARHGQGIDPEARIQTGPGLPAWRWHSHRLEWSGPVSQEQTLELWLLSPLANKALTVLRLLLLAALLGATAEWPQGTWRRGAGKTAQAGRARTGFLCLLVLLFGLLPVRPATAALPGPEQLQTLRDKLTRPAECLPDCATIARLHLQVHGPRVVLGMELHAALETALPLPGGEKHWLPEVARLDGRPARIRRDEEGGLWLLLPAGTHRLELTGPLLKRDMLQLPLPLKPYRVDVQAEGWEVSGLSADEGVADTLQLVRQIRTGRPPAQDESPVLPPFLQIERRLLLDLQWRVETTVRRDSPPGVPVVLSVPLLPGESVTTPGISVKEGKVQVNLGPQTESLHWSSTLSQRPALTLTAAVNTDWVEHWVIRAASVWHLQAQGIPPVALGGDEDADLAFRPWPGESLHLRVERPAAISGQTLTIDQSVLTVSPGARASDAQLRLKLRSSQGGEHALTLPPGAVLQRVSIDGSPRPLRLSGDDQRQLLLPLIPGSQWVELAWRLEQGMHWHYETPPLHLGQASVNHRLSVALPRDRWLLFASGPGVGPAILFWGKLLVLLALAVALGRTLAGRPGWPPMGIRQWLLLALGLTQLPWFAALIVVAWFLAFAWRAQCATPPLPAAESPTRWSRWSFNLRQLGLVLLTLMMLGSLFQAVEGGLLGQPDMQVLGNESSPTQLNWVLDRAPVDLPLAWVLTLPLMAYRGLMLLWALWLSWSLLSWLKWGWQALCRGELWRRKT